MLLEISNGPVNKSSSVEENCNVELEGSGELDAVIEYFDGGFGLLFKAVSTTSDQICKFGCISPLLHEIITFLLLLIGPFTKAMLFIYCFFFSLANLKIISKITGKPGACLDKLLTNMHVNNIRCLFHIHTACLYIIKTQCSFI